MRVDIAVSGVSPKPVEVTSTNVVLSQSCPPQRAGLNINDVDGSLEVKMPSDKVGAL